MTLTKGEKGLGFTVAGSHFIPGYFYVKDVLYDPALSSDKIKSGDRLLLVNTHSLRSSLIEIDRKKERDSMKF